MSNSRDYIYRNISVTPTIPWQPNFCNIGSMIHGTIFSKTVEQEGYIASTYSLKYWNTYYIRIEHARNVVVGS